jgi:putative tricarboxylic transport membrane protein
VGGAVSAFISYAAAKRISKNPETFGEGNIEGVIAAEVANDAKEGGSLLPTVAFGIPGSPDMAVVLGAFVLHGLQPGPLLIHDHLDIVMTLAIGFSFSQIIASVTVFFAATYIARLAIINTRYLSPVIIILCLVGSYAVRVNIWDVFLSVGAGIFGFFWKRYGFPVIPIAIGYILGNLAEKSFHQALMMSYGSFNVFFSSPICIVLSFLSILLIISPYIKGRKKHEDPY